MAEQGSPLRTERLAGALPDDAMDAVARAQRAANAVESAAFSPADSPPQNRLENAPPADIAILGDVSLHVQIELGRTRMYIDDLLRLTRGSVVELDRAAGDPADILVNGQRIARGEIVVLNDQFCVRVTEILDPDSVEHDVRTD
jgi:flagellar motor switch protein FliN/FliY